MKKILLLTTAVSIFAASSAFAQEGNFYVKGHAGLASLNKTKVKEKDNTDGTTETLGKYKAKNTFLVGLGGGYYFTDSIRFDGTFDHSSNVKFTRSSTENFKHTMKLNVSTLMANGYMDLLDVSSVKLFAGAGLGVAMVKGKHTVAINGVNAPLNDNKIKNSASFAYALHLGASTKVTDSLHADLAYSWRDYGKVKDKNKDTNTTLYTPIKGHHVTLGLRYDI